MTIVRIRCTILQARSSIGRGRGASSGGSTSAVKPRTEERDVERARASRDELAEQIARHVAEDGTVEVAPGLFLVRYSLPTGPLYAVSEPSFCIIVGGDHPSVTTAITAAEAATTLDQATRAS